MQSLLTFVFQQLMKSGYHVLRGSITLVSWQSYEILSYFFSLRLAKLIKAIISADRLFSLAVVAFTGFYIYIRTGRVFHIILTILAVLLIMLTIDENKWWEYINLSMLILILKSVYAQSNPVLRKLYRKLHKKLQILVEKWTCIIFSMWYLRTTVIQFLIELNIAFPTICNTRPNSK